MLTKFHKKKLIKKFFIRKEIEFPLKKSLPFKSIKLNLNIKCFKKKLYIYKKFKYYLDNPENILFQINYFKIKLLTRPHLLPQKFTGFFFRKLKFFIFLKRLNFFIYNYITYYFKQNLFKNNIFLNKKYYKIKKRFIFKNFLFLFLKLFNFNFSKLLKLKLKQYKNKMFLKKGKFKSKLVLNPFLKLLAIKYVKFRSRKLKRNLNFKPSVSIFIFKRRRRNIRRKIFLQLKTFYYMLYFYKNMKKYLNK